MRRIIDLIPPGRSEGTETERARRGTQRFPLRADVVLEQPFESEGFTINVSEGGLRIALDHTLYPGETCVLRIRTSPLTEFREIAEVVWSREEPDGCIAGMRFIPTATAA